MTLAICAYPCFGAAASEAQEVVSRAGPDWTPWLLTGFMTAIAIGQAIVGMRRRTCLAEQVRHLREENARLRKRADVDPMTGFLNRDAFLNRLAGRRRRCDAGALLVIDADHFKQVNDRYGHQAGDEALMAMATAMRGSVREDDLLGRIGGEEFAILLAGATAQDALLIAERIRCAVEAVRFEPADGIRHRLTVSVGGVSHHPGDDIAGWMHAADTCLYQAKSGGRNLVVIDGGRQAAA
ncbi:MAG: GGDEF domain-containing protein [Notoacmeibacter sp.]|nr:GGDEF domain-containing protein [Notoacmeibacter sp.]MCC0032215.1 GGDEF domain-containing protein [Brucellaceae bacterium]